MDSLPTRRNRSRSPRRSRSPKRSRSRSPRRNRSPRNSRSPRRSRSPRIRTSKRSRSRSRSPYRDKIRDRSRSPDRSRHGGEKDSNKHKKDKRKDKDKHKKDKHKERKEKHKKDKHKHKDKKDKKSRKDKKEGKGGGNEEAVYVEKTIAPPPPEEKKDEDDYIVGPLPFHMVRRPETPIEITEEIAMRAADKGLVKHTVRAGEENVYPEIGARVTVKYTGKFINGKQFDSSEKFSFALGKGQVIQGWDIGVSQMALGEKAQLIIGSQCGYGRRGSPPTIPPNCILVFDVELLDIY